MVRKALAASAAFSMLLVSTAAIAAPSSGPQDQQPVPPADVVGAWTVTMEGPQGSMTMDLTLAKENDELTGTIVSEMGEQAVVGKVEGNELTLSMYIDGPNGSVTIYFWGQVEENKKITGTLGDEGGQFSVPFSAVRKER